MIWILLAILEVGAPAAEADVESTGVRVAFRASGETWRDDNISSLFRSGTITMGAGMVIPILPWLVADLEATYRQVPTRMEGDESHGFKIFPVSLLAEVRYPDRADVTWFAGLGPSVTLFSEYNQDGFYDPNDLERDAVWLEEYGGGLDAEATPAEISARLQELNQTQARNGGMIGLETRVGVRMDLGLVHPPAPPAPAGPIRGVDLEVYASRRWRAPWMVGKTSGLELQAWRLGAGLALRF